MGSYEIDIHFQGYCPRLSYWRVFYQACAIFRLVDRAGRQFSMVNNLGVYLWGQSSQFCLCPLFIPVPNPRALPSGSICFFLKHPGGPNPNYTLVSYFSGCDRHLEEHLKGGDIYLAPSFRER